MKTSDIIEQLRLEQTYGFVYLLLFYKQVKKAIGKKKALQILNKTAIERRLSWYKKHKDEIKKGKDDFETVLNYFEQLTKELSPGQDFGEMKPETLKKGKSLILKTWIWCPIAEACKIVGIEPNEVCRALDVEADMAIIEKLCPNITYQLIKTKPHSKPHYQYCEFLIRKK